MSEIVWHIETRKLSDLRDYPNNPRKMGKEEFNSLVKSLKEDGYHQRLLVDLDGTIIGGHSRKKALLKAGYTQDSGIEVLVPNIPLSGEQFDRINIRDNLSFGVFDFDMLASNFDAQQLIDWGMPPAMLGQSHYDIDSANDDSDSKVKETKVKVCPSCGELLN